MKKTKQYLNKHKYGIVSLVLLTFIVILFCISKRSFHVDESLSFALSNHPTGWVTYEPFGWFEKSFFQNYAVTDSPFNYARVYSNQYWDVHPPLYYYFLHTICSFFPYRLSIWFGLIINIISYIISSLFVYLIVYKIVKKDSLSSMAMLMFGLNKHVLDCAIFTRMYMLSTMFVLLFLYFAINIIKRYKYIDYIGLFVITVLGGLTHYHFYFIIASISIIIAIYLIIRKDLKTLLCSFVVVCSAILLNLFLFFPATLFHLNSSHANTAKESLNHFGIKFSWLFNYINISSGYIIFFTGLIILFILIFNYKKQHFANHISIISLLSFYLSFIIITHSTNMFSNRYIIPAIPLLFIGIPIGFYEVFSKYKYSNIISLSLLAILILINISFQQVTDNLNTVKSWDFAKEHQYGVAVVLTSDDIYDYEINELFTDLRWYLATGITQQGKEFSNTIDNDFVLYIQKQLDQEKSIDYLKEQIADSENLTFQKQNINKNLFYVYEVTFNK